MADLQKEKSMKTAGYILLAFIFLGMKKPAAAAVSPAPGAINAANTAAGIAAAAASAALSLSMQPSSNAPPGFNVVANPTQSTSTLVDSGLSLTQSGQTAPIFVDSSGDLVTINSTGGTTTLPDPNGIGGGFAT
jgi:hypothetical protein